MDLFKRSFLLVLFLFPCTLFANWDIDFQKSDFSIDVRQGMLSFTGDDDKFEKEFNPGYYIEGGVAYKINKSFSLRGGIGHFSKHGIYIEHDEVTTHPRKEVNHIRIFTATLSAVYSYPIFNSGDVFFEAGPRYFFNRLTDKAGKYNYNKLTLMIGGGFKFYLNREPLGFGESTTDRGFFVTLFTNYSFYSSRGHRINPWILGVGLGYNF